MKKQKNIVLILVFGLLISGLMLSNVRADAAVETPNVLSGTAVKDNNKIYYRIQNKLYRYNIKSKKISKLCTVKNEITSIRKYGNDIYLLTECLISKEDTMDVMYKYNIKTSSTEKIGDNLEFIGIMDGVLYCEKQENADVGRKIISIDTNGETVVQNLGKNTNLCFIWDNKLYYSMFKPDAKPDKYGDYRYEDSSYYYMTSDRTIHSVSTKEVDNLINKYIAFASYPEKSVYNMITSATWVKCGKKENVYYGHGDNKKSSLVKGLKNNKKKKLYTIKAKTKKYKSQFIYTMNGFKKQMIVVVDRKYKKKKNGYSGEYVYKLVNYKGRVIKTLGKKKYKNSDYWEW